MNLIQNFMKSLFLDGATTKIKQYHRAKRPPQQYWDSKYTYHTYQQLSSTLLMNKLNKIIIRDRRHPCLTPGLIENSSERLPLKKKKKKIKKKKKKVKSFRE